MAKEGYIQKNQNNPHYKHGSKLPPKKNVPLWVSGGMSEWAPGPKTVIQTQDFWIYISLAGRGLILSPPI